MRRYPDRSHDFAPSAANENRIAILDAARLGVKRVHYELVREQFTHYYGIIKEAVRAARHMHVVSLQRILSLDPLLPIAERGLIALQRRMIGGKRPDLRQSKPVNMIGQNLAANLELATECGKRIILRDR